MNTFMVFLLGLLQTADSIIVNNLLLSEALIFLITSRFSNFYDSLYFVFKCKDIFASNNLRTTAFAIESSPGPNDVDVAKEASLFMQMIKTLIFSKTFDHLNDTGYL